MKQRGRDGEMEVDEAVTPGCQGGGRRSGMTRSLSRVTRWTKTMRRDGSAVGRETKAGGDREGQIAQAGGPSVTEKGNKEGIQAIVRYPLRRQPAAGGVCVRYVREDIESPMSSLCRRSQVDQMTDLPRV